MPKRTRKESQDINQFAASVVAQSTGSPLPVNLDDKMTVSRLMSEMGRRGGLKGAATLNAKLSPAQRKKSAQKAALARWGRKK
jgi:hypothetical protein